MKPLLSQSGSRIVKMFDIEWYSKVIDRAYTYVIASYYAYFDSRKGIRHFSWSYKHSVSCDILMEKDPQNFRNFFSDDFSIQADHVGKAGGEPAGSPIISQRCR